MESYESEECVPRKLNGKYPAQLPVACQAITCNIYPWVLRCSFRGIGAKFRCSPRTDDCTGGAILPVPIPLAGGLAIINPFDLLQLVGGSVLCKNLWSFATSNIPPLLYLIPWLLISPSFSRTLGFDPSGRLHLLSRPFTPLIFDYLLHIYVLFTASFRLLKSCIYHDASTLCIPVYSCHWAMLCYPTLQYRSGGCTLEICHCKSRISINWVVDAFERTSQFYLIEHAKITSSQIKKIRYTPFNVTERRILGRLVTSARRYTDITRLGEGRLILLSSVT